MTRSSGSDKNGKQVAAGRDGTTNIELVCDCCDKRGHGSDNCGAYKGKRRGYLYWAPEIQHSDASQQNAAELQRMRAGSVTDIVMRARVEPIDVSGLACFYLTIVAGLALLPRVPDKPASVGKLVAKISTYLRNEPAAASLRQTLSGMTLGQIAAREGLTVLELGQAILRVGTTIGLGGTEMGVVAAELWAVNIFYWQVCGKGKYRLIEVQRPGRKARGHVHAEYQPVLLLRTALVPVPLAMHQCVLAAAQ